MSLSHLLRTAPAPLTAIGLLGGFALIATGILPLAIGGAVFIGLGLLVPYLRLPTDRGGRTQDVDDAADVGSMRALHRERSDAAQGQASMPETWP